MIDSGKVALPILVATVIVSEEPRLSVAMAKTPEFPAPLAYMMPSFCIVAPRAMTSGIAVVEAENNTAVRPV
jgi:hypothetical protein